MEKDKLKFKVIEGGKAHSDEKCECPVCQCKCPVCGTTEITVTFRPEWELDNDSGKHIVVRRVGDFIRVACPECGVLEYSDDIFHEDDADLSNLSLFFKKALGLPVMAHLEYEDGATSISRG